MLLLLCFMLSLNSAYSFTLKPLFKHKKDSACCLEINGKIIMDAKHIKGTYKAELIYIDKVVDSAIVKSDKSFTFVLKRNMPYFIRVSKAGYVARTICVNTNINETANPDSLFTFSVETELIDVAKAMRLNNEALELPAAIISFDNKTGSFNNNTDYALFVKNRIYEGM